MWLTCADAAKLARAQEAQDVELDHQRRRFGAVTAAARHWRRKAQGLLQRERAKQEARAARGVPRGAGTEPMLSPVDDYLTVPTRRRTVPRQLRESYERTPEVLREPPEMVVPAASLPPTIELASMERELEEAMKLKRNRTDLKAKLDGLQRELEHYSTHDHASAEMLSIGTQRKASLEKELQEADLRWHRVKPKVEHFARCIGEARARGTTVAA